MFNTAHTVSRQIAHILANQGVDRAVLCPGSRNAPLCVAFERQIGITTTVVIDERSAAFMALGMAVESGRPVAVICTSGTAPLNFAPAIAEAYYRGVPLIAITADRPADMIDKLDSQTIKQPGIFANFIKKTYDIDDERSAPRQIIEALDLAVTPFMGPVHLNVRIGEPIGAIADITPITIDTINIKDESSELIPDLTDLSLSKSVLVVAACANLDTSIHVALNELSNCGNVVIVQDPSANIGLDSEKSITAPDAFFAVAPEKAPEYLITIGGAPISGTMKKYLRSIAGIKHWSIGQPGWPDTYGALERTIDTTPHVFINALCETIGKTPTSGFKNQWFKRWREVRSHTSDFIKGKPFTVLQAVNDIVRNLPESTHLHLSNGMTVRYAQYSDYTKFTRVDCNRGVSGIDGCTSTAIGAAMCTDEPVVLLSGDMSAQYDMGALATDHIPDNFKMIVFSNGGGNIFRHIGATRHLDEVARCLVGPVKLPLQHLADAYCFSFQRICDRENLLKGLPGWIETKRPAMMEIVTDGPRDADNYIKMIKYVKERVENN